MAIDTSNPYDVLKNLILKPTEFQKLPDKDKSSAFFILNRILAQFNPTVSNSFNVNGIYAPTCMDFYSVVFQRQRLSKLPNWVYSKFASKHKKSETLDKDFYKYLLELEYCKEEISWLLINDNDTLDILEKKFKELNANT